jgi:hypothetical protein
MRFLFQSLDYSPLSVFRDGAYVDNIWILGYAPPINPALAPPSTPRDLVASAGIDNVTLSWNEPLYSNASSITGYVISYGTSPDSMLNQITWNQLVYVLDDLSKGQTYYFKVSAQNSAGWGPNSTTVAATPAAPSPSGGGDMTLIIAIVAVVAIVGVGAAVFYLRKKK